MTPRTSKASVLIPLREIPDVSAVTWQRRARLFACAITACAAWTRLRGCDRREWLGARSMAGGIDRWTTEVDPLVPRY